MACKLPGYVGRDVALEIGYACGDVDPLAPDFNWIPFASLRTKEFNLTWDTADATSDSSPNSLRENLATFKTLEISGDGVAKQATLAGEVSTFTQLTKHVANPGPEFSDQPVVWLRMTFPDLTFIAYMLVSDISRSAAFDDVVTFSFTAQAASSDFGLIVLDTPDPSVAVTSVTLTPNAVEIADGQSVQLLKTVLPVNATAGVTWSSSDEDVATVSAQGLVTAVGAGTCNIVATSTRTPAVSGTCALTVV